MKPMIMGERTAKFLRTVPWVAILYGIFMVSISAWVLAEEPKSFWKPYTVYVAPLSNMQVVKVIVRLDTEEATRAACEGAYACLVTMRDEKGNQYGTPIIHAVAPKNFNDDKALSALGHEIMHLMGAMHD